MRKGLILGLFILACLNASAQGKFALNGGYCGYILHTYGAGVASYSQYNSGFSFGASFDMPASPFFSIQPELNYFYLSTKEAYGINSSRLDYLYVPVLLKIHPGGGNFSVYVGPQLGFLMSAINNSGEKNAATTDLKDQLTNTDFSGVLGIGYVTSNQISFNIRYLQGFSNFYKVEATSALKSRNEIFNVTIGYVFGSKP